MQEREQGLVMSVQVSKDDDIAGGSLISGIRHLRPGVALPPEESLALLETLGCPAENQVGGRVSRKAFLFAFERGSASQGGRGGTFVRRAASSPSGKQARRRPRPASAHNRRRGQGTKKSTSSSSSSRAATGKSKVQEMQEKVKKSRQEQKKASEWSARHGIFSVTVFFVGSAVQPCELAVAQSDTVQTLKQKIEFMNGYPAHRMHLFVKNRQVPDDTEGRKPVTVGMLGLKPGQELRVALAR